MGFFLTYTKLLVMLSKQNRVQPSLKQSLITGIRSLLIQVPTPVAGGSWEQRMSLLLSFSRM